MKRCINCEELKPLDAFYVHKKMKDGHMNSCKICNRKSSRKRYNELRCDHLWVEKERVRHRDKYKRLGYNVLQKEWDKKFPWKSSSKYKNLSKKFPLKKGIERHHWNYNLLEDFSPLSIIDHKYLHRFLILDNKLLIFRTNEGILLDTKEKHFNFLKNTLNNKK